MSKKFTKSISVNEDWTATIVSWSVIVLATVCFGLFGFSLQMPSFGWSNMAELTGKVFSIQNIIKILSLFVVLLFVVFMANFLMGKGLNAVYSFPILFLLTFFAMIIGGNKFMKDWGLETVIFSLVIGLIISNFFTVPEWLKSALTSELYIKIGLVLLGTTIIFGEILKAGSLGLIQSLVVVIGVWYFCFWLCGKMKIDKEMSMMLSSAVSICGVSAAVATAGAIKGDKKKLSYVVSLVMVVALPMIIIMPFLAKLMGLSPAMAGAWIGGTIDTTGAVVATGTMYGDEALKFASIVKFSQNVLLGIAAFLISIYWAYTKKEGNEYAEKPTIKTIWERFPKFVVGFIAASLVFSFILKPATYKPALDTLKGLQNILFAIGFTSIGLETNFKSLFNTENRRATAAFLIAQTFNVVLTLGVAWFLFGRS